MGDFTIGAGQNGSMAQDDAPTPAQASPIVGVGAVIFNARNEIVLIRRGQEPRAGEWSIPGGRLEWGESVREALLREVREETGLIVEIAGLIDVVDSVMRERGGLILHHYVLIDFLAHHASGELVAGTDAAEARWVGLGDLDQYSLWTETRRIIETAGRMRG
ncbi:MAG TPA: NUDIX hydrolase [Micropepsaceae bacterium]|nr:NUDIX hydrolase [Micropepsaceae bacterium]